MSLSKAPTFPLVCEARIQSGSCGTQQLVLRELGLRLAMTECRARFKSLSEQLLGQPPPNEAFNAWLFNQYCTADLELASASSLNERVVAEETFRHGCVVPVEECEAALGVAECGGKDFAAQQSLTCETTQSQWALRTRASMESLLKYFVRDRLGRSESVFEERQKPIAEALRLELWPKALRLHCELLAYFAETGSASSIALFENKALVALSELGGEIWENTSTSVSVRVECSEVNEYSTCLPIEGDREWSDATSDELLNLVERSAQKHTYAPARYRVQLVNAGDIVHMRGGGPLCFQLTHEHWSRLVRRWRATSVSSVAHFATDVFLLLARYQTLFGPGSGEGRGWHLGAPAAAMRAKNVDTELFASPLNSLCDSFCSVFGGNGATGCVSNLDGSKARTEHQSSPLSEVQDGNAGPAVPIDAKFGSDGSFFRVARKLVAMRGGRYECCPPYDPWILSEVAKVLLTTLENASSLGTCSDDPTRRLSAKSTVIVVVPDWGGFVGIDRLRSSPFYAKERVLKKEAHRYRNGFQHMVRKQGSTFVWAESDTLLMWLTSNKQPYGAGKGGAASADLVEDAEMDAVVRGWTEMVDDGKLRAGASGQDKPANLGSPM